MAVASDHRRASALSPRRAATFAGVSGDQADVLTLGPWRLERLLGEGAFTRVHLARPDDKHPAAYAVKTLRPARANDPLALAMLRREAHVGMAVSHPHVVAVLSAHVQEPPHYLVMPLVPGETLQKLLGRRGRLPVSRALWIARQIAQGLTALHEIGWRHGDVKPANILVSSSGHATLADLGLAQRLGEPAELAERVASRGTTASTLVGTLEYLAPEAFSPSLGCDARSDLYGLGITLFEMLTGRVPFTGREASELAEQHRQAAVPNLRQLRPDVPTAVADLVANLLAKQPLRRPHSATALVNSLIPLELAAL